MPANSIRVISPDGKEFVYNDDNADATVGSLIDEIRARYALGPSQHVRVLALGKELLAAEHLFKSKLGSVLHFTICQAVTQDAETQAADTAAYTDTGSVFWMLDQPPARPSRVQRPAPPPVDWLDTVNPATVLMWVFGSILAVLWLLYLCYRRLFDHTSLVILCMMSIAFLLPIALSYLPFPTPLSPHAGRPRVPAAQAAIQQQQAMGSRSTSHASTSGLHQRTAHYSADGGGIVVPPRPPARVRPGQPLPDLSLPTDSQRYLNQ